MVFQSSQDYTRAYKVVGVVWWSWCSLTWVVPATSSRAALPPASVKLDGVPETLAVITQSICCQVTDLQPGKLAQELLEGHPGYSESREKGDRWNQGQKAEVMIMPPFEHSK